MLFILLSVATVSVPFPFPFRCSMETSNNIRMRSSGISYKGDRPDTGSVYVEGEASWITPDGKTVLLKYTSDEGGYSPVVSISSK